MTVEYYVKRKLSNGKWVKSATCETSEQAVKQKAQLQSVNRLGHYAVFYSEDALAEYQLKQGARNDA